MDDWIKIATKKGDSATFFWNFFPNLEKLVSGTIKPHWLFAKFAKKEPNHGNFSRFFRCRDMSCTRRSFCRMFSRAFDGMFSWVLGQMFSRTFGRMFRRTFNRMFMRTFGCPFSWTLGRTFSQTIGRIIGRAFERTRGGTRYRDISRWQTIDQHAANDIRRQLAQTKRINLKKMPSYSILPGRKHYTTV
jgi:hypothetical protein